MVRSCTSATIEATSIKLGEFNIWMPEEVKVPDFPVRDHVIM